MESLHAPWRIEYLVAPKSRDGESLIADLAQATDEKIKQQKADQAAQSQIHTGIFAPARDPFDNIDLEDLQPRTGPKNGHISVTTGTGRTATGIGRAADRRGTGTVRVTWAPDPCDQQTRDVQVTNQQRGKRGAVRHAVVTPVNP